MHGFHDHGFHDDRLARRNALVLAVAQALGGANPAIVVALGGLVGQSLAPTSSLATLPVSLLNLGLAAGTIPAALLMRSLGRRAGYIIGGLLGTLAGALAAGAISRDTFLLFCVATFVAGLYAAFVQSYRFAAADSASPAFKARAISWVMAGGLAAGVIGPQTVILTRWLWPDAGFAGGFLGQGLLALIAVGVVTFLRAPPPAPAAPAAGRRLAEIMAQPRFILAVAAGLVSYGLMSFVMTAAPIAMVGCGHSVGLATFGISLHILAMYAPSFVTGELIQRFGAPAVTGAGLVLIALSAGVSLAGLSLAHFWIGLVLLGLGWNLGFIGATALVTECYRPEERAKVQAANDFLVFGSVAAASFSAGQLLEAGGWTLVNALVFPPVAAVLGLLASRRWTVRAEA
jgi:MFS family permease